MALKKYIIERDIPDVGSFDEGKLASAAEASNDVLCKIGAADIQWVNSYVAADKTFCVYLAKDEEAIKKHSEMSGFPATKITKIQTMFDPSTEAAK